MILVTPVTRKVTKDAQFNAALIDNMGFVFLIFNVRYNCVICLSMCLSLSVGLSVFFFYLRGEINVLISEDRKVIYSTRP